MSKTPILKALRDMEQHDPAGARYETEEFWKRAVEAGNCKTLEELQTLIEVVRYEGENGGPAYHAEIMEAHGLPGYSFGRALAQVRDAINDAPMDVSYLNPKFEYDYLCHEHDEGEEHTEECVPKNNVFVDARAVAREEFRWYIDIYGGLPGR